MREAHKLSAVVVREKFLLIGYGGRAVWHCKSSKSKEGYMSGVKILATPDGTANIACVRPEMPKAVFLGERKRVIGDDLRKLCEWKGGI